MADHGKPHFHNSAGVPRIETGARQFMCIGAKPPFDHPHVYLDMGSADDFVCPYCSTHFVFNSRLGPFEAVPADSLWHDPAL